MIGELEKDVKGSSCSLF